MTTVATAARSRRKPARSRAVLWRTGSSSSEDDARAYLQTRMTLFSKLMFWSIVALLVFLTAMYRMYPGIEPTYNDIIFAGAIVLLAIMALSWRVLLLRRTLSVRALYRLDVVYATGIGSAFAASALLAKDLRPAGYTTLMYVAFTVFMRAIVVPSSGRRTAILSTLVFAPVWAAAVVLAFQTTQELPSPAFIVGALVLGVVPILLSTVGSDIIYGLRRQVSEAMQLGQYTLERKIGEGGNGAVYRAHHALLRRPTAIKLLLPDQVGADTLDRFEREVQHMSQLTHPNTVAVFDYGRSHDGVFYYAMEYLDGIDLEHLVRAFGPQPSDRVVHILIQVCGALHEAHTAKLIHRDIKPAHIILCERGAVLDVAKVVDFGLGKAFARDAAAPSPVVFGTPAYIAPEAVTDPASVTHAVDLYGLGAVGYFLITGRRLFEGATPLDLCVQHVTTPPTPPSALGVAIAPALEAVLMTCLAKRPGDRYPSAAALADALEALPPAGDWGKSDAELWWDQFRTTRNSSLVAGLPTLTVTVDLDRRT
ncbi:MAG TPA: serine/threonine-protein kinase [Kofleriaceae bacterium]|nr:serine/threonine-protein kinase [Kofleriaceae bacterium]